MPTYHFDITQGTPAWDAARAGKWSASRAATIMGALAGTGLAEYIKDIAWGRVYGWPEASGYKSAAMERGNNLEPDTRERYAFLTDRIIQTCGFVEHSTIANVGWSPDGLVGMQHGIEVKNMLHKAYMDVMRTRRVPSVYRWQTKWALWVGELESLDFLCDHPRASLIVIPCTITESEKQQMAERVALLEPKVQAWIDILTSKRKAA